MAIEFGVEYVDTLFYSKACEVSDVIKFAV